MVFICYKLYHYYLKNACLLSTWECTREEKHRNCLINKGDYSFLRRMKKKNPTNVLEKKLVQLTLI